MWPFGGAANGAPSLARWFPAALDSWLAAIELFVLPIDRVLRSCKVLW